MKPKHLLACALALATTPALGNSADHWYVTPQGGMVWPDQYRDLEDHDALFGVALGKHLNPRWSVELNVNAAELQSADRSGVDLQAASLDVLRVFRRQHAVAPYATLGMGAVRADANAGAADTDFMAQAGVGLLLRAWQNEAGTRAFTLRPEVKVRWADAGRRDYFRDYLATIGLQFSFGVHRASPPPLQAAAVAATSIERAQDVDGDGVVDAKDRCPDTPRGTTVDVNGCPITIVLRAVNFVFDSVQLTPESRTTLNAVAADLVREPKVRVEIQGHTDSTGNEQYNLTLSQRRAEAVRDYIIEKGVPSPQLEARGYGESRPVADNDTAAGRARNRRVEMSVLANPNGVRIEGAAR